MGGRAEYTYGGTLGIWALQASTQYPEINFTGIDIESRNIPTSSPPNAEFLVHNITALPEEWSGTFDLVHQRLLLAALRAEESEKHTAS